MSGDLLEAVTDCTTAVRELSGTIGTLRGIVSLETPHTTFALLQRVQRDIQEIRSRQERIYGRLLRGEIGDGEAATR